LTLVCPETVELNAMAMLPEVLLSPLPRSLLMAPLDAIVAPLDFRLPLWMTKASTLDDEVLDHALHNHVVEAAVIHVGEKVRCSPWRTGAVQLKDQRPLSGVEQHSGLTLLRVGHRRQGKNQCGNEVDLLHG